MVASLVAELTDGTLQASPEKFNPNELWKDTLPLYDAGSGDREPPVIVFRKPHSPPMGPTSQLQRLQWPSQVWAKLSNDARARLVHNLKHVVWSSDYFCGMGSREQVIFQIIQFVRGVTNDQDLSVANCKAFMATENDPSKLDFLNKFDERCKPVHLATDIFQRLPLRVRCDVNGMLKSVKRGSTTAGRKLANRRVCEVIRDVYAQSQLQGSQMKTYCVRHPHLQGCPVSARNAGPDDDSDVEFDGKDLITFSTAAPPCKDASLMNRGEGVGDAGRTVATTEIFLQEAARCSHDVYYVECTRRWSLALLRDVLLDHRVFKVHLEGSMLGDRYNRLRLGGIALGPRVALTSPLEDFLEVVGQSVSDEITVGSFFCATKDEEAVELSEWRQRRSVPRSQSDASFWDWTEVLLESHKTRLASYEQLRVELVDAKKLDAGADLVVDLDQNPQTGFGRYMSEQSSFATLLRHGTLWSMKHRRPLLAVEMAKLHCWPTTSRDLAEVGGVVSIGHLLQSASLSCNSLVQMLGDGWHLRVQGSFIMWLLSSLTRTSASIRVMKRAIDADDDNAATAPTTPVSKASKVATPLTTVHLN